MAVGVLTFAFASSPTHAATGTPSATEHHDAFALGFVLENSHQDAYDFIESVKALRDVNDDAVAGKMVDELVKRGEEVRHEEGKSLVKAAELMSNMHAPKDTIEWARKTAKEVQKPILNAPHGIESEELVTEHLTSIIDETSKVQKEMVKKLGDMLPVFRMQSGDDTIWAFDAGTYDAQVSHWSGDGSAVPVLRKKASHLVSTEPAATPAHVDHALRAVLPGNDIPTLRKGSGNLASLLPGSSVVDAAKALKALPPVLVSYFDAGDVMKEFEKAPAGKTKP